MRLSGLVVATCLVASVAPMQLGRLRATRAYLEHSAPEDLYYLPQPAWLQVLDLGYHEATADSLWATALVYAGAGIRHRMSARYVVAYARAMTTLDRTWMRPYQWALTAAAYQVTEPSVDQLRDAGLFAEEGASRFPESGDLAWSAGAFLAFELAPRYAPESSERADARRRGLRFLTEAARRGSGPSWLAVSNAASMSQAGNLGLAIEHLEEVLSVTTDPDIRAQIVERLGRLDAAARSASTSEFDALERRRRASRPYLPLGLFELVGGPLLDASPDRGRSIAEDPPIEQPSDR